jgi:ATP-dependent Clp protease ATP-binding subunit ClpC
MKSMLKSELEGAFRPEFLTRVDEIVVFRKLGHDDLVKIVDLEVGKLAARLVEKGLTLELTQEAKDFLIEKGTDEKFGARPLRRAIEQHVEDPLSEALLRDEYAGKGRVIVSLRPGEPKALMFEGVGPAAAAEPVAAGAVPDAT